MLAERLHSRSEAVLQGPLLLIPPVFSAKLGWFCKNWDARTFDELLGIDGQCPAQGFVQDNHSCSSRGMLRGLHDQLQPHAQGKLVRCVAGAIVDVAVDIRHGSATVGQWVRAQLSAVNRQQLWIPPGFAHGFLSLCDGTEVLYKTTDFWARDCERTLWWNDPQIEIDWELEQLGVTEPLLAPKDAAAPLLPKALAAGEQELPSVGFRAVNGGSIELGSEFAGITRGRRPTPKLMGCGDSLVERRSADLARLGRIETS